MERRYLAFADTGRDYIDFEFFSSHRANSKANKRDAEKEYMRKHGHTVTVRSTSRLYD